VKLLLQAPEEARETVERVHKVYMEQCPVYKTLRPAIGISSSYQLLS
jgi:hypothetical protein